MKKFTYPQVQFGSGADGPSLTAPGQHSWSSGVSTGDGRVDGLRVRVEGCAIVGLRVHGLWFTSFVSKARGKVMSTVLD